MQSVVYVVGYSVFTGCRLLRDLLLARVLGPDAFGVWATLALYRQYSAFSDFGVLNGLARLLPRALAERHIEQARALSGMAWVSAMTSTALVAVIGGAMLRSTRPDDPLIALAAITLALLMFVDKQYMYMTVLLQSTNRVAESGVWMAALGASELALAALLPQLFGLVGLYVALLASSLATALLMMFRRPISARYTLVTGWYRQLLVTSLVLLGIGLANIAIQNADRTAVLYRLGPTASLGTYHLAAVISAAVGQLPTGVLAVLTPQLYRLSRERRTDLRALLVFPSAVVSALAVGSALVIWVALPVVSRSLPAYPELGEITLLLMLAQAFFVSSWIPGIVLVTVDRGRVAVLVRAGAAILAFIASTTILSYGLRIAAVAAAMLAVHCLAWLLLALTAARQTATGTRLRLMAAAPLAYGTVILLICASVANWLESAGTGLWFRALAAACALVPLSVIVSTYFGRGPLARNAHVMALLHWPPPDSEASGEG